MFCFADFLFVRYISLVFVVWIWLSDGECGVVLVVVYLVTTVS